MVNVELEFDARRAAKTDRIDHAVDYKALTQRIIDEVEQSRFFLLEKLADHILTIVMGDPKVARATVEVDKPRALRFADSVSVSASACRAGTARRRYSPHTRGA